MTRIMKDYKKAAVILVLHILMIIPQVFSSERCPDAEIEDCLRPLDPLTTNHRTILPSYDQKTLANVCRSFKQIEQCLAPLKPVCGKSQSRVYTGVKRATDFLCGHGLNQSGHHNICFAKDVLATEGRNCNLTASQTNDQSSNSNRKRRATHISICQDADRFMRCVKDAVLRHCGGGAALWVENVNSKVFSPLLEGNGCYRKKKNWHIAFIFGITIVIFILTIGGVAAFIVFRRKQANKNRMSLSMLAMSLEEQSDVEDKPEDNIPKCTCKNSEYYKQYDVLEPLPKVPESTIPFNQDSCIIDNFTRKVNEHRAIYELVRIETTDSEEEVENGTAEQEIDQSSPKLSTKPIGRLQGVLTSKRNYSLLPPIEECSVHKNTSKVEPSCYTSSSHSTGKHTSDS